MLPAAKDYVVKKGETLSKIALYIYGDASQWRRIFEANRSKLKDPNSIQVGQILKIPAPPAIAGVKPCNASNTPSSGKSGKKQRSEMTPEEQLANPEAGAEYPMELEAAELLLGLAALLKGLLKMGAKVLAKKGAKKLSKNEPFDKVVIDLKTGKEYYPNSFYTDKSVHPLKAMKNLNEEVAKQAKRPREVTVADENSIINEIHEKFIRTGEWPIRTPKLKEHSGSLPDAGLQAARKKYLDELKKHE